MYKRNEAGELIPALHTERLILRKIESSDVDRIIPISFYNGKCAETRQEAMHILDKIHYDCLLGESLHWGIIDKETNLIIGSLGFYRGFPNNVGELGYILLEEARGKGYATEAARAVLTHAFETMRLNSVCAYIEPGNQPSVNVITRLGFKETPSDKEGLRRFEIAASER